eukprot:comp37800_c0_seq1/m.47350 comp37800_c0_seq1/g.47350  ORF comp37800_c0_seq1/g.47350 comp37800_c0_seq1/m.47350 type:complete len:167 (-) comp37800_c0_seq1:454-954(-)
MSTVTAIINDTIATVPAYNGTACWYSDKSCRSLITGSARDSCRQVNFTEKWNSFPFPFDPEHDGGLFNFAFMSIRSDDRSGVGYNFTYVDGDYRTADKQPEKPTTARAYGVMDECLIVEPEWKYRQRAVRVFSYGSPNTPSAAARTNWISPLKAVIGIMLLAAVIA